MKAISFYLILLLPLFSVAQKTFKDDLGNIYTGEFIENDFNGKGTCVYVNGEKYVGEWNDGVFSGSGKFTFINGDYYDGKWLNGLQEGIGKMYYSNGKKYFGNWKEGSINGHGTLFNNYDDTIYSGYWQNNLYHGDGVLLINENEKYTGQFRNGIFEKGTLIVFHLDGTKTLYSGKFTDFDVKYGTIVFPNGSIYTGNIENLSPKDRGNFQITFQNGNYSGEIKDGLKDGHGKMKFNNSDYYSGNWQNDLFHGLGKMIYADNSVYEGQWDKGMKNGSGQMTYSNGDHFSGYWSQNRIQNGTLSKGNGETLSGEFNEKGILVSGTHKKPNGEYFSGRFSEDGVFQSGTIKIFLSNGDDYEGDYLDGKFTGKGKFVYADGSSYEGELVDGKKNGNGIYKTKRYEITGNWSYDERNGTKKKLYLDQIFTQKYGYTSLGISYTGFPLSSERSVNQVLVNFSYYTPKFINFGFGLGTFGVKDYYSYYEVYDPYPVYIYKPINNTSSITKNITAFNAEANIGVHVDLYRRITLKCNYSINATGVSKTIDYEVYKDYNNTENYSYIMEGSIWTHGLQPEIMFNSRILQFGLFFRKSIIHDTYPKFVYHNPVYDPVQIITFNNLPNSLNFVGFRLNFRID